MKKYQLIGSNGETLKISNKKTNRATILLEQQGYLVAKYATEGNP